MSKVALYFKRWKNYSRHKSKSRVAPFNHHKQSARINKAISKQIYKNVYAYEHSSLFNPRVGTRPTSKSNTLSRLNTRMLHAHCVLQGWTNSPKWIIVSVWFFFINSNFAGLSEEWAFATKLKDFNEAEDDRCDNDLTDIEIFAVKFLGSTLIDEPRSEKVTANAIQHMISKTKCKRCPHFSVKKQRKKILYSFHFDSSIQQEITAHQHLCVPKRHWNIRRCHGRNVTSHINI